jgi:hypothetical protein
MARFDDIRKNAPNCIKNLRPISQEKRKLITTKYPDVPEAYLDFLTEVGAGDMGGLMMLYDGFVVPLEIYDPNTAAAFEGVLLIADDYQGYGIGLKVNQNWAVVELDPSGVKIEQLSNDFESFIRAIIINDSG